MANLEEIRRETERAFAEAGITDADLSYLTEELVQEAERDARAPEDLDETGPEGEARPEWGNLLWNVWFTGGPGSRVYGYLLQGGSCGGSWYVSFTWNSRSLQGRCSNRNSYIWRVG
jgi:hypothetical protein